MASRQGSLLEENAESIFSSAGFNTETNKFLADYEIDVIAEMGDIQIIAECKQYEKSNLQVKNLIHQWKGKNDSIGADIVILVIYGQDISDEERSLARDNNILIWDEDEIKKLLNKDDEAVKNYLFNELPVKNEDLGEAFSKRIKKLVWKPYLEGDKVDDDYAHEELLLMVKERIRRELFQRGTSKKERKDHIRVFEEVTKKGLIRSEVKVKDSEKRFQKITEKLNKNKTFLSSSNEVKYLDYMKSVEETYKDAKEYYLESSGLEQVERLVEARLNFLMRQGGLVALSPRKKDKPINATRSNSRISLDFEIKNAGDLETIRWILMKEGKHKEVEKENNRPKHVMNFFYDDIEDAKKAVIRIMDEYYGLDFEKIRLVDNNKDELARGESFFTKLLK